MLQATNTLLAKAGTSEEKDFLTNTKFSPPAAHSSMGSLNRPLLRRRLDYCCGRHGLGAKVRARVCSRACLKVVYLACATLISASFIIECILLHLIVTPYLAESAFERGKCRFNDSRIEGSMKRCENKCSKERSNFPCYQILVIFTPMTHELVESTDGLISSTATTSTSLPSMMESDKTVTEVYDFASPQTRPLYLYDYFSTFAAHKASRCSTSPCHRREEDNKAAVNEFILELKRKHIFECHARPYKTSSSLLEVQRGVWEAEQWKINASGLPMDPFRFNPWLPPSDPKGAAAILHLLHSQNMFFHSTFWPGSTFIAALIILLCTYCIDGCEAWAGDQTVIA